MVPLAKLQVFFASTYLVNDTAPHLDTVYPRSSNFPSPASKPAIDAMFITRPPLPP